MEQRWINIIGKDKKKKKVKKKGEEKMLASMMKTFCKMAKHLVTSVADD